MTELSAIYRVNETNLALRRQFMGLDDADMAVLKELAPWAGQVADEIAREFYDHQFGFEPTLQFFRAYAGRTNRPQETSATTHEVATAAADLARTADELEQIVAGFKLSTDLSTNAPETS